LHNGTVIEGISSKIVLRFKGLHDMKEGGFVVTGVRQDLQIAAGSATMRHYAATGIRKMVAARKISDREAHDDSVFDDADALIALAQKSFKRAAKEEVAKNDSLGIPTHGSADGKLVVRQPTKAKAFTQP
jgi:hypothetical protein